jgi:hypothetical protein
MKGAHFHTFSFTAAFEGAPPYAGASSPAAPGAGSPATPQTGALTVAGGYATLPNPHNTLNVSRAFPGRPYAGASSPAAPGAGSPATPQTGALTVAGTSS